MHQEQGIYMELLNVSLTPAFLSQLLTARLPCEREEEAAQAGFKSEVWKWQQCDRLRLLLCFLREVSYAHQMLFYKTLTFGDMFVTQL